MKKNMFGYLSLAALVSVAACGGGGGDSGTTQAPADAKASGTVTMSIPLKNPSAVAPASTSTSSTDTRKPQFIDGNSNGRLQVFFDGITVIDFGTTNGVEGAGPSGTQDLTNGGKFTYTSTITMIRNQPVATITGTYTSTPGVHTLGAVQTNGACSTAPGAGPCLENNLDFVLAEGQTTLTLQPGDNDPATLFLRGVMQSVYICDDDCDGHAGKIYKDGLYHLYVVVADENGTAIPYQKDAKGNVIPFDNGSYQLVEDPGTGPNLLSIYDTAGNDIAGQWYATPGNFRVDGDGDGSYGIGVKVKCNLVGTTKLVAKLDANGGTPSAPVTGFTVTPGGNYPTANMVLGSVGADQFFGNQLTVSCESNGTLVIQ